MKTIIAATDFSKASLNAVNYAADMARVTRKELVLVHAYPILIELGEVPVPDYSIEKLAKEANKKLTRLRDTMIKRTKDKIRIRTELMRGDIVPALKEYSQAVKPYAVVMGPESTNTFERFLGGSTLSAIKHLPWPVIIVPAGAKFKNIRRIGLACDLQEVAETLPVKELTRVVKEFDARLYVVHVSTEKKQDNNIESIEQVKTLKFFLRKLKPEYHYIKSSKVEKSINDFADDYRLDLLIIIPRKHIVFRSIFKHRHSKRLVLHIGIPLMSIHE